MQKSCSLKFRFEFSARHEQFVKFVREFFGSYGLKIPFYDFFFFLNDSVVKAKSKYK